MRPVSFYFIAVFFLFFIFARLISFLKMMSILEKKRENLSCNRLKINKYYLYVKKSFLPIAFIDFKCFYMCFFGASGHEPYTSGSAEFSVGAK